MARAVSNLLSRDEGVAEQVLATHWEQHEFYEDIDPKVAAEIAAATRVNLTALLDCLASGEPLGDQTVQRLGKVGRRGFLHGVPLDAILTAYQVGARIVSAPLFDELGSVVADPEQRAELVAATTPRLFDLMSRACEVVTAAYKDAQQAAHLPAARVAFLEQLLTVDHDGGRSPVPAEVPAGRYLMLEVVPLDGHPAALGNLRDRVPGAAVTGMLWDPLPHRVVLVPAGHVDTGDLGRWAESANVCVVAEAAWGLADVARLYRGVRRRLAVIPEAGTAGVLGPVDLTGPWLASLLTPDERLTDVASVLGAVLARRSDWAAKDVEVLQALAATDGVTEDAAARLGVTPGQVRRHATEIAARLGIDLDSPLDQVKLGWALLLHRTAAGELPAPGDQAWTRVGGPATDP